MAQKARDAETTEDQALLNAVFDKIHEYCEASRLFQRLLSPLGYNTYDVVERVQTRIEYAVAFGRDHLRAELNINFLGAQSEMNGRIYRWLESRRPQIEQGLLSSLEWDFKEGRQLQKIRISRPVDRERLLNEVDQAAKWAADHLIALRRLTGTLLADAVRAASQEPLMSDG